MRKDVLAKRRGSMLARAVVESIEKRILLTDVLSYHGGDLTSQGVNDTEVQLTPGNVTVASFGKQFTTNVTDVPNLQGIPSSVLNSSINYTVASGQVYAEPLVMQGVNITTGAHQGVHDVVFVATAMDSLFAIDANGGTILWKDSFIYNASGNPNPLNANVAAGVTSVPGGFGTETNSQDVSPWIGIIATPVIDPVGGFIYLTDKTREVHNGDQSNPHYVYSLHKVNLSNGADTSVVIADTTLGYSNPSSPTYTYNSGPYVLGTGDGAITVNGQSRIYFNAVREMDRPALTLYQGRIYTEWASHGDNQPYHGWVLTYDANTLAINGAFNTTPNSTEGEGGIWGGGGIGAIDSNGFLYVMTGNGKFDGSNGTNHAGPVTGLDANGFPVNGDYGDSFLKIALDATTSQGNQGSNKNGWGLKVVDYFSPYNNKDLDGADRDLGSGAPMILPDAAGSAAHPHLLIGGGKEGKIYLIDRDNMGKFGTTDNVVQTVTGVLSGVLSTPAYFNGRIYFTPAYGGSGVSWLLSNATINTSSGVLTTPDGYSFPGTSPVITANGTLNGIAWMIDKGGQLRAYDAANINHEIWNSSQNAARDALGNAIKFTVATPVNGRVYVGSDGFLTSYGPPIPPTSGPADPTNLVAVATGASTIQLTWKDNSTNEDGFSIERSNDGITFNVVGTAGVNATTFQDSGLASTTKYYYRLRAYNSFNSITYSNYTSIVNATTLAAGTQQPVDQYNLDEGTGTKATDAVTGNNGTLTGTTLPAWVAGRIGPGALSFSGNGAANQTNQSSVDLANNLAPILGTTSSLAFWIKTTQKGNSAYYQSPAVTGVEQSGGGNDIGWGWIDPNGHIGVAVGNSGTVATTNAINDGQWHHIAFTRNATTGLVQVYVDGVLNNSGTLETGTKTSVFKSIGQLTVDAADGITRTGGNYFNGQLDDVRIYNQILDPTTVSGLAQGPAAPTNLVATPASGTEIDLTWNDNATTETGYKLERSDAGGPFVQIGGLLPASSNSYDDVGLLQGVQYAYRVRATNGAADSANSNTVTLTTPVPPLTPSNATPVTITATTISITWQDNSNNEDGVKVLREVVGGEFAEIAKLPPNTQSFVDTNNGLGLLPGTQYDYHIQEYNVAGYSDFTGFSAVTLAATPMNVQAKVDPSDVSISWNASAGATSYNIYRGLTPGSEGNTPYATDVSGSPFVDTNIDPGQFYYYRVTSVNSEDAESPFSSEVTNNPSPAAQFAAPVSYPTGTNAHGVSTGDVNGDGKLDLIVANAGSNTVSVLLGNGNDTFKPAVNYSVGTTPKIAALADLNGDTKLDIVTGNQGSNNVSVLINNGDGTFKTAVNYAGTANPHSIALADLDGDHDIDIAEVGWGNGLVRVMFNNGSGVFSGATDYTVGNQPHSVVAADFNGDTIPDLAVADYLSNNIAVLINKGNGTFNAATYYNTGTQPHSIIAGDFNHDNYPDLATANDGSDNVSVFLNKADGSGTFANAVNYGTGTGTVPKGVNVGDVNNDGNPDIVVADSGGNYPSGSNPAGMVISVLLGNADGTFDAAVSFPTGNTPFSAAIGDFDGDGDLDVATANWNSNDVTVLKNLLIDIPQPNHPPVATPDSASAVLNQPVQINVLANDTDSDGVINPKTVLISSQPGNGSVSVDPNTGIITYTSVGNFTGNDFFSYTVKDDDSAISNAAQVTVNVSAQALPVYLSDLAPTSATNGYGPYEKDKSNGEQAAGDGKTITLNGVTYAKGLGTNSVSTLVYNLGGQYTQFLSDVGIDDEEGTKGSVNFQVFLDNSATPIYDSGVMTGATATKSITINVTGATTLKLVVTNGGDNNNYDHGDWANARLVQGAAVLPPAIPTMQNPGVSQTQVSLTWTEPASNQTGFRVERKTGAGGTYAQIADVGAGILSFPDTNVTAGTTYFYHVYAYNTGGNSNFSNEVSATVPAQQGGGGTVYLSDLTPTSATNGYGPYEKDKSNGESAAGDGHTITLNGATYAKGLGTNSVSTLIYNLGGQYTQFLSDVGIDDEEGTKGSVNFQVFLDNSATPIYDSGVMTGATATKSITLDVTGKTTLKLVVTNGGDNNNYDHGDWANARLVQGQPPAPPAAPTGLTATYNNTTKKVDLTWVDSAGDQTGFRVERKLGAGGTYAPVTTVSGTTFSFSDPGPLAASSTYFYRVFATNSGGDSQTPSNEQSIVTPVATSTFLSDLTPTSVSNGYGPYEKDTSNGESAAGDGHTITLNGVTYAKGLGVHAPSDISFNLGGQYSTFTSDIGIDDEKGTAGSVVFQVYLDGTKVYDSGTMTGSTATKSVNLSVVGVTTLRLVVTDGGNGNNSDHADWAGAQLLT